MHPIKIAKIHSFLWFKSIHQDDMEEDERPREVDRMVTDSTDMKVCVKPIIANLYCKLSNDMITVNLIVFEFCL